VWSSGQMAAEISLRLPSARRWTARDGPERVGRRGTAEAVHGPFVHVTSNDRDQGGDGTGPAGRRRCDL
jgi:hypothetical protein